MRRWRHIMIGLACLGLGTARAEVLNDTVNGPHPVLDLPARLTLAGVTLHHRATKGAPRTELLGVARGGQILLRLRDQHFELNYLHPEPEPLVIATGWSGGAHCCYTLHVLSLAPRVRHQAIGVDDNDEVGFIAAGDAPPLLQFGDFNFAYWHTSFADSPAPRIILRYDPAARRYAADFPAMHRDAPDAAALKDRAGKTGPELWGEMLDLIYTGNAPAARRLLDLAWPSARPGKLRFLACFTRQLRSGRLWHDFHLARGLGAEATFPPSPIKARACRADW